MIKLIERIGRSTIAMTESLGRASLFLWMILVGLNTFVARVSDVTRQLFNTGVLSLPIIMVSGLFVGMVLALQGYNTLKDFGAEDALGVMVALSMVRELGPVVAALLFAGRAGSSLTAEIGLMKTTEQLSALEMMAVNPVHRVVMPRFVAAIVALPLLTLIFMSIGMLGAHLVGVVWLGVDAGAFWGQIERSVDWHEDILNGMLKSIAFAFAVAWIALYQGYESIPTSEGVGRSTTRTVVQASLWILGLDFVLTALMFN